MTSSQFANQIAAFLSDARHLRDSTMGLIRGAPRTSPVDESRGALVAQFLRSKSGSYHLP